ncbi:MAG: Cna B-type domain-containing protein, partial [Coriobacteriia bacterium]|nr:Cna B-type domain-containing protein [Coriobacteriia bacterium]
MAFVLAIGMVPTTAIIQARQAFAAAGDITVTSTAAAELTAVWNDNSGSTAQDPRNAGDRPTADDYANNLQLLFQVDGGGWTTLTEDNRATIGLDAMPAINVNSDTLPWHVSASDLPTAYTYEEPDGTTTSHTVAWAWAQDTLEGYLAPVFDADPAITPATVTNNVCLTWKSTVSWLDNGNLYTSRPGLQGQFTLYRYVAGSTAPADVCTDATLSVTANDDNTWSLALEGAQAYSPEGLDYIYYVVPTDDALDADTGNAWASDAGSYQLVYTNQGNYSSNTDGLYYDGNLTATLVDTTHFEATKIWEDDGSTARPACTLYLYRIAEDADGSISTTQILNSSPVQGFDNTPVATSPNTVDITIGQDATGAEPVDLLPAYDNDGRRYIYFGLERGATGDYQVIITNDGSPYGEQVKATFADPAVCNNGAIKFVLNGGTIKNDRETTITLPATKTFYATAMQSMEDAYVVFQLQKNVNGGGWQPATSADLVDFNPATKTNVQATDTAVNLRISGFSAELMSITDPGLTVQKYVVATGASIEYRWVETTLCVNGGFEAAPTFDGTTGTYGLVNADVVAPGLLDKYTTAFFQPKQVSNTEISNTLQGELQVTVTKTWTDAKGNNISNDGVQLSGVSATFNVTRNDGKTTADGSLLDSSGKVVQPLVLTQANYDAGAQAWVGSWSNLVRYDETGTEYLYKVSEATISDPQSRTWSSTHTVVNSVTTTTDDAKIIKKEVKFANTTGPIPTLDFDVEKQWLDGDDALTRYPVQVGVYRITTGEQVATAELRASNDWYARISVAKADDTDTTANYVVKEIQINNVQPDYGANTDQQIYDQATTHTGNYAYANAVGVLDEGDANHNLAYKYNVFVERTATVDRTATYVVTNQRVGVLNLNLTKTWTMAASKPDATFAVYSGTTQLDKAALDGMGATVVDGAGASVTVADGGTFQLASGTDNTATVRVQDLPKYDTQGNLITYSLVETSMTLGGETQAIVDGVAQLSGDRYVASISENVDKRVIVGPTKHNSGDEYYWEASNARSETYNLTARKVWRDDGTALNDVARPDIHLSVYRVLPSDVSGLTEAIAAGNTGQIISAIRGAGNAWQAVSGDHFWDTTPNDWYWECDLGSVERYSSTGEAYVYFFTESYPGDRGHYQAIYSNLTSGDGYRPTEDVPDTGDTVDVYSVTRNQLISASGNLNNAEALCLLSDGVHAVGTDVGAYYSGTVVNYREDTRTITARKMWLLPTGWVLPDSAKPSVAVHLYVSDTPLTDDAGNVVTRYTHDILQPKLQNSTLVTTVTLNGTDNPGVYEHEFQNLPRYDEFGRTYYYFLDESIGVPAVGTNMYPGSLVDGTNFTIENVYDMTQGNHVKVTVNKTWTSNTVAGVTVDDLTAPATFNLYAQAQDANGNLVGEKIKMSAVTFTPSATQQSYTFMKYTAGKNVADYTAAELAACNDLPEEGANNRPMVYWVEEDTPNGYKSTLTSSTGGSADNPVAFDSNYAGTVSYSNEYTGAPDDVTFTKIWEDASTSIDTSYYRPRGVSAIPGLQNLHFTVSRAWPGNPAIPGDTGGSETVSAVQFPQSTWDSAFTAWKTTQTYEKYAPNGMPYTYKVDSEQGSYNDAGGSISFLYTHVFDGTTATNTLKTVSVSGAKKWIDAATGETLSWADFSRFSNYKDALPTHVTLAVQYCYQPGTAPGAQNKWKFIDDTDPDGQYAEVYLRIGANAEKTDANVVGGTYLGKTWKVSDLTQSTYNNMSISYADLPRYTATSQSSPMDVEIPYRVVEGLTWADGTTTWYYADDAVNDTLQAPSTPWKAITGQITRTVSDTGTTCTLNNTVGTVPITVVKDWVDNSNRDDTRPISLEVYFSSKDGIESTKVTLAKSSTYPPGDRWTATLSLPMPSGGTAQLANLFNVNEDTVTLTTLDYTQTENTGFVVNAGTGAVSCSFTNTLDDIPRATTSAAFTKTFKDDGAWASLTRPTVRYQLYAERMDDAGTLVKIDDTNKNQFFDDVHLDQATAQTVTIDNNTGSGSVTWEGLYQYWPRNETNAGDPQKIVYRVQEELLDSNGNVITTSAYSADNPSITAGGKITNTLQTTDVTFTKNWVDSKGNVIAINATLAQRLIDAGLMPVKLQFSAEYQVAGDTAWTDSGLSVQHTPAELLSRPTWNAKLPAYDKDGKALTWRVHEQVSYDGTTYQDAGYYANVVPNDNGYFTATNGAVTATNTLNYGSLTVTKAWDDDNNRDGVRPASVTVNLYRDGATTAYATATLSANNNWTYTFDYLPAYQDVATGGTPTASTWTVEEAAITVDTTKVSTGYTVSYMIEGATTSTTTLAPTDAKSATITNTHVPERINVPVTKTWVGQMYPTKVQNLPNDLTVQLYMDDTAVEGSTLKLNDGNSWTGSFTNLYKYRDAGTLIDYTVAETAMGILYGDLWEPNCTSTVTGSAADGYTITNTLETADVQVSKTWLYPDGTTIAATDVQDLVDAGELPTTLRFALDQSAGTTPDWVPTGFTVDFTTVDLADGPQTWDANLLRHARVNSDGTVTDYDYQLRETAVSYDNGTTWVNIEDTNLTTADAALTYANGVFTTTVNNTFPTGDLTVTKTWDDGDNRDGLRPTSVNVKLYRDGATTAYATATLSAANNWTYTFQDLPVYKEGTTTMSVWTVTETAVDGYTTSYEPTSLTLTAGQTGSFAITNSHTPATTSVSGTKTWTGLHSNDSLPAQITVNLLANGTKVQSKTVTAADNWAYSFDNLYQYENGALIAYTVTEDAVPQFTTAVKGFNIVNTYAPAKTSVSGTKTWANMSVYDSKPASITLRLTGTAGDAVVRTDTQVVTQAADGTWTYEFADLDAYTADNQAITYTVEEQAVPYFTTTYTATDAGFDITNIYAPDTVTVAGTKTWKDVPEGDPLPQQVFVVVGGLDESGTLVRGAYKWVSAADNWAYTFTDLPGHTADGQQITYKVDEMPMEGFTPTITGYDILNTYTPDKTFFTANKVWAGTNAADHLPASIELTLTGTVNGQVERTVTQTVTPGA